MRSLQPFLIAVLAASVSAGLASSQQPAQPPLAVSLRVVDSAGLAIEGADVSIVQNINDVRASGTTDARGRVSLTIAAPSGDYQVVVRKIGFSRADRFFHAGAASETMDIRMQRAVQTLATVQITEQQDLKRKSYFIDADEIAKHADILIDATDILKKLRPDMICGRSCFPMQAAGARARTPARACPGLVFQQRRSCPVDNTPPALSTNVWVNGIWIRSIPTDTMCQIGRRGILAGLSPGTMQVLCEIQPEHIEQITYADEFDTSVGKNHSDSAIFIVLKTGVGYQPGAKSYVVDESADARKRQAGRTSRAVDSSWAPHDSAATILPAYRRRIVGVFDQDTGEPIDSARVTDAATGDYVRTTATGTASLVFLPEGSSVIVISKPGYDDLKLSIDIAPAETEPLTLLLKRKTPGAEGTERAR